MNFRVFPVETTRLFPASNSHNGGQLMTEYNLRSLNSVDTNPDIQYFIGKSFVHSASDFSLAMVTDSVGNVVTYNQIKITSGRAIVNGYYVQLDTDMILDIQTANAEARQYALPNLTGRLAVGLKAYFSTESTMMGSLDVSNESEDSYYDGVQVVVLPVEEFTTPSDSPEVEEYSADIKLGEFSYVNGAVSNISNETDGKLKSIDAVRIGNIDTLISETYVTRKGLDPRKLYVFSGKELDPSTGRDTWCDALDSLMVWDNNPTTTYDRPTESTAEVKKVAYQESVIHNDEQTFVDHEKIGLIVPHKQVDGMTDSHGNPQYYASKQFFLPVANFDYGTSGTVDRAYTASIKAISRKLDLFFQMGYGTDSGVLRGIIYGLDDRNELPKPSKLWKEGDYIIVTDDKTVDGYSNIQDETGNRAYPTTMYVWVGGYATDLRYIDGSTQEGEEEINALIEYGYCIDIITDTEKPEIPPDYTEEQANYWAERKFDLRNKKYIGSVNNSYLCYDYDNGTVTERYYYEVSDYSTPTYSEPVLLTLPYQLATTGTVGGFKNVEVTDLGQGYVYCDSEGHLRVLDYEMLSSGVLAYQFGQNALVSETNSDDFQTILDQSVNNRIVFPNTYHIENEVSTGEYEDVIHLTLEFPTFTDKQAGETVTFNLHNLDSRFNTCLYLHLRTNSSNNIVLNISDCQRLRIDNSIFGVEINLDNVNLYYDSSVLNYVNKIEDLSLWYQQFEDSDTNLLVNGMEVLTVDAPSIVGDFDYWNPLAPNDNHFMYALRSLKFDTNGNINGGSIYIKNASTNNISMGKFIYASKFNFSETSYGLQIPLKRLVRPIKITGTFVSAYPSTAENGYITSENNFSLQSNYFVYTYNESTHTYIPTEYDGTIAFLVEVSLVTNVVVEIDGASSTYPTIDAWNADSCHIFEGGVQF